LAVGRGGTGATTLTDGGILLGSGAGAITPMARLADSELIVGQAAGDPVIESGATLRTSIGVDAAGTDNSTNVTLSGTPNYITISGQVITRGLIDLLTDVTNDLPIADGGTGAGVAATALSNLGGIGAATTNVLTNKTFNANAAGNALSNVDVADLANGVDGELITWAANAAPATVAVGTSGQVLTSGGAGVAPTFQAAAGGGGAVTREGGNTTEATTTSTSAVDLLTAGSLTIAALQPLTAFASTRMTSGAANNARVGVKLNTTSMIAGTTAFSIADAAEAGGWLLRVTPRLTNYTGGLILHGWSNNLAPFTDSTFPNAPTVEITDVILRANVTDGATTVAADEMHAYSWATS